MKRLIRDRNGATVGYVLESCNGVIQAFTPEGKRLGQYNPCTNTTVNQSGAVIGFGDLTSALIIEAKNN